MQFGDRDRGKTKPVLLVSREGCRMSGGCSKGEAGERLLPSFYPGGGDHILVSGEDWRTFGMSTLTREVGSLFWHGRIQKLVLEGLPGVLGPGAMLGRPHAECG